MRGRSEGALLRECCGMTPDRRPLTAGLVGAVSLASVAEKVPSVPTDDLVRASKSLKTRDDFKRSTTRANKVDGEGGRILGTFDAVDGKGIVRMEDMLDTNI